MNVKKLVAEIDLRFKSANSVPVSRVGISKDEWARLRTVILALAEIVTSEDFNPSTSIEDFQSKS